MSALCLESVPSASTCVLLNAGSGEDTSCLDLQQAVKSLRIVPKITRTISSACMQFTCRIDATIAYRHPSILVQCNPPVRQQRWRRTEHGRARCLDADQEMLLNGHWPLFACEQQPVRAFPHSASFSRYEENVTRRVRGGRPPPARPTLDARKLSHCGPCVLCMRCEGHLRNTRLQTT